MFLGSNQIQRLNKEVKWRADGFGIFPNEASMTRLICTLPSETNDEWQTLSCYMTVEVFARIDIEEMVPFTARRRKLLDHALRPTESLHRLDGSYRPSTQTVPCARMGSMPWLMSPNCSRTEFEPFCAGSGTG